MNINAPHFENTQWWRASRQGAEHGHNRDKTVSVQWVTVRGITQVPLTLAATAHMECLLVSPVDCTVGRQAYDPVPHIEGKTKAMARTNAQPWT
jgi:hypothetical protein